MKLTTALLTITAATLSLSATAQEDAIRKALAESDDQIARGETVPHAEVMQRARRWANR